MSPLSIGICHHLPNDTHNYLSLTLNATHQLIRRALSTVIVLELTDEKIDPDCFALIGVTPYLLQLRACTEDVRVRTPSLKPSSWSNLVVGAGNSLLLRSEDVLSCVGVPGELILIASGTYSESSSLNGVFEKPEPDVKLIQALDARSQKPAITYDMKPPKPVPAFNGGSKPRPHEKLTVTMCPGLSTSPVDSYISTGRSDMLPREKLVVVLIPGPSTSPVGSSISKARIAAIAAKLSKPLDVSAWTQRKPVATPAPQSILLRSISPHQMQAPTLSTTSKLTSYDQHVIGLIGGTNVKIESAYAPIKLSSQQANQAAKRQTDTRSDTHSTEPSAKRVKIDPLVTSAVANRSSAPSPQASQLEIKPVMGDTKAAQDSFHEVIEQSHLLTVVFSSSAIPAQSQMMKFLTSKRIATKDSFPDGKSSILVIGKGPLKRTSKVLSAFVLGKHIVTDDWITESALAGRLLDYKKFTPNFIDPLEKRSRHNVLRYRAWPCYQVTPTLKRIYGDAYKELTDIMLKAGARSVNCGSAAGLNGYSGIVLAAGPDDPDAQILHAQDVACFSKDLISMSIVNGRLMLDEYKLYPDTKVKPIWVKVSTSG